MSNLTDTILNNDFDIKAAAAELGVNLKSNKDRKAFFNAIEADEDFLAAVEAKVIELRDAGALFVINHSAGKDSQAMNIIIEKLVPQAQRLVIHAQLPQVDWDGLEEHIVNTIEPGSEFRTCVAVTRAGETKTFFDMVEMSWQRLQRQGKADKASPWPSPTMRQCTSDLKNGPIEKVVRHFLSEHPEFNGLVVDCIGIRSEESCNRSNAVRFVKHTAQSIAGRTWYKWLPIKDMLVGEVFSTIEGAGQKAHWAYAKGMSRLSCCFCIMSSTSDVRCAAKLRPELFERIINTERRMGKTFMMPRKNHDPQTLDEYAGITVDEAHAASTQEVPEDLNSKEQAVLVELTERSEPATLASLAEVCFPEHWNTNTVWAKRQVSNSVRRLVARDLARQVSRGTYAAAA